MHQETSRKMYNTNQGRRRWAIAAYYFVVLVTVGQFPVPASLLAVDKNWSKDRIIKPISLAVDAFGTQQHHHRHRHEQFNVRIQRQRQQHQQQQQRQPSVAFASKSADNNEAAATMAKEAKDTTITTRTENEKQARYVSSIIKRARFALSSEKTTTTTNTTMLVSSSSALSASAFNNEYRKKRKQRVIEKIKRTYFSYQIESRILRILLYPIVSCCSKIASLRCFYFLSFTRSNFEMIQ